MSKNNGETSINLKAIRWEVIVVPIFIPSINETLLEKAISPELTRPAINIEEAVLDWSIDVKTAPKSKPFIGLSVRFSIDFLIFLLARLLTLQLNKTELLIKRSTEKNIPKKMKNIN